MNEQLSFGVMQSRVRTRDEILLAIHKLQEYHSQGVLGGERMPEDANPGLGKSSAENFHYFTLPMALNFQRNSYKLWESALETWKDLTTQFVFFPDQVALISDDALLRTALTKYKVALQPNKHTAIWRTISNSLNVYYNSDIRNLFSKNGNDIAAILEEIQTVRKKDFPYLSGQKIANYWLYVMSQYADAQLTNKQCLSVAPDTHIIQASIMLGVVEDSADHNALRPKVADAWKRLLEGTGLCPIDIHTPLWLWSRKGFIPHV